MRLFLVLVLSSAVGACGEASETVHEIDLTSLPEMEFDEWSKRMAKYKDRLVRVSGCSRMMLPHADWDRAFWLWPCHTTGRSVSARIRAPKAASSWLLVVDPDEASGVPEHFWPEIRVTGRLQIGEVMVGRILYAYGAIRNATWETVEEGE